MHHAIHLAYVELSNDINKGSEFDTIQTQRNGRLNS